MVALARRVAGSAPDVDLSQAFSSKKSRTVSRRSAQNRHRVDTARLRLGWRAAKLLLELVELMGIEPMTS